MLDFVDESKDAYRDATPAFSRRGKLIGKDLQLIRALVSAEEVRHSAAFQRLLGTAAEQGTNATGWRLDI